MTTLLTGAVVKLAESVEDKIYNFKPDDAPLLAMIDRGSVDAVYHEWQRDEYRTPNKDNAAIEGADAAYSAQSQPTLLNNRTQIFQDTFQVSNTTEAVKKYGRDKEVKRLTVKKAVEIKRDIEAAAIASGATVAGTGAVAGKTRGLYGFITNDRVGAVGASPDPTTNTAPTAGTLEAITEANLQAALQSCFENGGSGSVVMCSPSHKVRISTFGANVQKTNEVGGKQAAVVNTAFDFYRGDFGVTKVVPNRIMAGADAGLRNTVYILDADKLQLLQLRPYEREQMATTGDSKKYQVRTEVMLKVRDEKPLYAIRDCTVSGA
jgi:hypothetical protein